MKSQGNPKILSQSSKLVLQVYRSVASREAAITRLHHLERNLPSHSSHLDEIENNLISLRHATLDCVDAIAAWRGDSNCVWVDPQTSGNFLEKIKTDLDWLGKSQIAPFFDFADKPDPFLVHLSKPGKHGNPVRILPLSRDDVDRIRRAEKILADEKISIKSLRPVSGHPLDKKPYLPERKSSEPALTVTKISKRNSPATLAGPATDLGAVAGSPAVVAGPAAPLVINSIPPVEPPAENATKLQRLASAIVADLPGVVVSEEASTGIAIPRGDTPRLATDAMVVSADETALRAAAADEQGVVKFAENRDIATAQVQAKGHVSETIISNVAPTEGSVGSEGRPDKASEVLGSLEEPHSAGSGSSGISHSRSEASGSTSRRGSDNVPALVPREEITTQAILMPRDLQEVLEFTKNFQVHEGDVGTLVERNLRWRWVVGNGSIAGVVAFERTGSAVEIFFCKTTGCSEPEIGNLLLRELSDVQTVKSIAGNLISRPNAGRNFRLHMVNVLALGSRDTGTRQSHFFQRPNVGSPVLLAEAMRKIGGGRMYQQLGNFLEPRNTEVLSLRDKLRDNMIDLPEIAFRMVTSDLHFPWKPEISQTARELLVTEFQAELTMNFRKSQNNLIAVPIQAVAQADKDSPKIFYLATSNPEIFVFLFSAENWEAEEDSLAKVTAFLQRAEIRKSTKFDFLGIPPISENRQESTDAFSGLPVGTDRLGQRLFERTEVSVGPDLEAEKDTIGSLSAAEQERTCFLREPFILGLWHSALDKLDMPLWFMRVLPDPRRLYGHYGIAMRRSVSGINMTEGCEVIPVSAEGLQFEAQFQTYAQRCRDQGWSPEDQWLSLHKATQLHRGREAPRWFWLCKKSGDRVGLLVYRVTTGKRTAHVLHLSVVKKDFMSIAVKFAKGHIFSCNKSIKFIRVSLTHERESLTLDQVVDNAYKDQGFRWFQMTQTEEGDRVTVMSVARNALEDGETDEMDVISTIFLRQANIVGLSEKPAEVQRRPTSLAIGNRVVLAQSLRALHAQEPHRTGGPGSFVCDLGVLMEKAQSFCKCVDAEKTQLISGARMKAAEILEYPEFGDERWGIPETSESASEQLVGCMQVDAEIPTVYPAQPLQALRDYETSVVEVVSMSRTPDGRSLYFFRTENAELMIFLAAAGDISGGVDLYREVDRWLKNSKQTATDHQYVMIPAFAFESLRHTEAFAGIRTGDGLTTGRLYELTRFAVRGASDVPGVLKTHVDIHNTEVITEDFVFGFWHASLDDIDVPLFATLVDISAWIKRGR